MYHLDGLTIHPSKHGLDHYEKLSYPVRYGTFTEISSGPFVFQFNLNREIKYAQCKQGLVMAPTEWVKRTVANDWVYYVAGGYNGSFDAVGEYYVPCFTYPSNTVLGGDPFKGGVLDTMTDELKSVVGKVARLTSVSNHPELGYLSDIQRKNDPGVLKKRADTFHRLIGGEVSVLPPDARHVDYDVIPVTIQDGCAYKCRFCTVKTNQHFSPWPRRDIENLIQSLRRFYGRDIKNFNSVFLGQHDALKAGRDLIEFSAERSYSVFGFEGSHIRNPRLFLFGTADSFLESPEDCFKILSRMPYETFINIGLESVDGRTLKRLGKPLSPEKVTDAFVKMKEVNRMYPNVEVTANFLFGDSFSKAHIHAMLDLIRDHYPRYYPKGAVYLSPFGKINDRRTLVSRFKVIKNECRLPMFLYIIQRM